MVKRLLCDQFPAWRDLPVVPVASAGTDHALYRVGPNFVARLPRRPSAREQIQKEQLWLPVLQTSLPLEVPVPIAHGRPSEGYPWHWSIYRWIDGATAASIQGPPKEGFADDLAAFMCALRNTNADGGPAPGPHNEWRGEPLANRDEATRTAIFAVRDVFNDDLLNDVWSGALQVPLWSGPLCWVHGDLLPSNLLVRAGRLAAVIDFGLLGVGDPAVDLMIAWALLTVETRASFRAAVAVDDATWNRGRGWALSWGVIAFAYYRNSNLALAAIARAAIEQAAHDGAVERG